MNPNPLVLLKNFTVPIVMLDLFNQNAARIGRGNEQPSRSGVFAFRAREPGGAER
jgi:hypothetical protein